MQGEGGREMAREREIKKREMARGREIEMKREREGERRENEYTRTSSAQFYTPCSPPSLLPAFFPALSHQAAQGQGPEHGRERFHLLPRLATQGGRQVRRKGGGREGGHAFQEGIFKLGGRGREGGRAGGEEALFN